MRSVPFRLMRQFRTDRRSPLKTLHCRRFMPCDGRREQRRLQCRGAGVACVTHGPRRAGVVSVITTAACAALSPSRRFGGCCCSSRRSALAAFCLESCSDCSMSASGPAFSFFPSCLWVCTVVTVSNYKFC